MKIIMTGMNGTVAPFVAKYFVQKGYEIIAYNRDEVPTDNEGRIEAFIQMHQPKIVMHFALGSNEWTKILASICDKHHIDFVYISTVSVFSNENMGPHDIYSKPDATDDYGQYKIEGEKATQENHKNPYIIRLGWQIGYEKTNNQMLQFLYEKMRVDGVIKASCLWYPSTSFIKDTAQAIHQIVSRLDPGIYHVNSNDQYTYFDIVTYLTTLYPDLRVLKTKDFKADHRMIDDRVSIRKFSEVIPQSK